MSSVNLRPIWAKQGWIIVDPRPWRLKNPDSFYLPSRTELSNIKVGNSVKLWFDSPISSGGGERLWAVITAIDGNRLTGTVDNGPHQVPLSFGDIINFRRHHIMDIDWSDYSNPSKEVKEIRKIMGMFDYLRRSPNAMEIDVMAKRANNYFISRDSQEPDLKR